jgi:hypothetical protein
VAGEWETIASGPSEWEPVTGTQPAAQPEPSPQTHPLEYAYNPLGPSEAALSIGSGMAGQVAGGLSGLVGAALPGPAGQGARWSENVSSALTYKPRSKTGQAIVDVASLPGRVIEKAASAVGEQGEKVSPELATIGKTSVHALPLLLGVRSAMAKKAPLTPEQQAAGKARDLGVRLTPEEMGAGAPSRTAASLAGEPRLARSISNKNQPVWNQMISEDLGLKKGTQLSRDVTENIRAAEGKAYEAMRKAGTVDADHVFTADLKSIVADLEGAAADFPHRQTAPIKTVVDSLGSKRTFDANSAVSEIVNLRKDAKKAFKQGDTELGLGSIRAAAALENLLDRHIAQVLEYGPQGAVAPGAMEAFRAARVRIAKSYAADKAMDATTGNINPQAYAKMLQQNVPLTGGAEQVGRIAGSSPRSAMKSSTQATGASWADILTGIMGSITGGLKAAPLLFARPSTRAFLASRAGQALMDPRTNVSGPAMQAVGVGSVPRVPEETE